MCDLCDGRTPDEYLAGVRRVISRFGCAVQYVESSIDESGIMPAFAYTAGLSRRGHPEIVITGRVADQSAMVLNVLAERVLDGVVLQAGDRWSVAGLDLYLVDVDGCEDWLVTARQLYGDRVRGMQAVWADAQGRLPWEGRESSTLVQPVLGPPPGARLAE